MTAQNKTIQPARQLRGEINIPGDKSISHRSLIFNAIAEGSATITNFLPGEDCFSTAACLRALGVEIDFDLSHNQATITGRGLHGLHEPENVLDAGNSGTTMRLLSGLLSGFPFVSILTGDSSLRSRPMRRVIEPLTRMGAVITGRKDNSLAPLVIKGSGLRGINYQLPVASAQLKSCLLLASLYAEGKTVLSGLIASRDHTERLLSAMGAPLAVGTEALTMRDSARTLKAMNIAVPGDISSAAFWLVAASVHPDAELTLRNVGVNPTRTGIIDALREMGASITLNNPREMAGEPLADITVRSAPLKGIKIGGEMISRLVDEIPALSVAALFAEGVTTITDAAELRIKETDRIAAIAEQFGKLGATVDTMADGLSIRGQAHQLTAGTTDSLGDHRLAMSLAILGLIRQPVTIARPDSSAVSYPTFWDDLARISQQ